MKAFAIDKLGEPGSVQELPVPEPDAGEVRIRVAAAGLNPFDSAVINGYLKDRMEHRFPLVPGMDASGTVEAVGEGVTGWAAGDEAFGSVGKMYMGGGTLAEFATMSAATIARKPASIDHAAAAAIPVAGVTALMMADALAIEKGDVVVAIGATGGVGSYFVQIATSRGAHVVAVCSGDNADYARTIGAAEVIDYNAGDLAEAVRARHTDGIAAVADMHGDKEIVALLAQQIRDGGRVATATGSADVEALGQRGIEGTNVMGRVTSPSLEVLTSMVEQGEIKNPQIERLGLSDAAKALETVGSGHVRGKIVLMLS